MIGRPGLFLHCWMPITDITEQRLLSDHAHGHDHSQPEISGIFPKVMMDEVIGLSWDYFNHEGIEFLTTLTS